jgi:hypothetical protein
MLLKLIKLLHRQRNEAAGTNLDTDAADTKAKEKEEMKRKNERKEDLIGAAIDMTISKEEDPEEIQMAWHLALGRQESLMNKAIEEEEEQWTTKTAKIKRDLRSGDQSTAWAENRRQRTEILPRAYMLERQKPNGNGTYRRQVSEKSEVLNYIRQEVQKIAEPPEGGYLTEMDQAMIQKINAQVQQHEEDAIEDENWTPTYDDVTIMMKYFGKAHTSKTASGPDGLTAGMFLFAHSNMIKALYTLLKMIAAATEVPQMMREMDIVLAHKEGRDPQNIGKSFRPLCIGSLLTKAVERVAKTWVDELTDQHPLHPAIMAYMKGIGHDMAIVTMKEAILHARRESTEKGQRMPRIYAVGIDIENAFNGAWRQLIEHYEWEHLGLRGTKWSIVRSLSGDMKYKVKVHSTHTTQFQQKRGLGQGPILSPGKYNISTHPLLEFMEKAGAGITVDGEVILGTAWSDDLLLLVYEDKLEQVMQQLEVASGKYQKKTKESKVFLQALCRELPGQPRPTIKLGGKVIRYKENAIFLGATLQQKLDGGQAYLTEYRERARRAEEKVEATKVQLGNKVRRDQVKLYYETIVEPTTACNLATTTLTSTKKRGAEEEEGEERKDHDTKTNHHGYKAARVACAKTLRRMLGAGQRCPAEGLYAELNWDLPDRAIIEAKLGLADRLRSRGERRRREGKDEDYIDWMTRLSVGKVKEGWTGGFHAETKGLWEEAGMGTEWTKGPGPRATAKRKRKRKRAARKISTARLEKWLTNSSDRDYEADYWQLYDGTSWRTEKGTKEEVGLMTTARLGALMLTGGRTGDSGCGNPICVMCGQEEETMNHMMLRCRRTTTHRQELEQARAQILNEDQQREYNEASQHEKRLITLGKQTEHQQTKSQQRRMDKAAKTFLRQVNEIRMAEYQMTTMTAATLPTRIEMTMKLAGEWEKEQEEENRRRRQGAELEPEER